MLHLITAPYITQELKHYIINNVSSWKKKNFCIFVTENLFDRSRGVRYTMIDFQTSRHLSLLLNSSSFRNTLKNFIFSDLKKKDI